MNVNKIYDKTVFSFHSISKFAKFGLCVRMKSCIWLRNFVVINFIAQRDASSQVCGLDNFASLHYIIKFS